VVVAIRYHGMRAPKFRHEMRTSFVTVQHEALWYSIGWYYSWKHLICKNVVQELANLCTEMCRFPTLLCGRIIKG